jgi:DegV family protein with EDD domain
MRVAVVTDSMADLPKEIAEEHGVSVVPLTVIFGEETFLDGVDMTSRDFFARLKTSSVMPSTSQPSPADFIQIYDDLLKTNDHIVSVHASHKLSGTYQSACIARDTLESHAIDVIDSKQVTMCEGFAALEAARAAQRGASPEEICEAALRVAGSVQLLFTVDTLEFLERNGRIGKAASLLGTLLSIKPIIHLEDGEVAPRDKVLGARRLLPRVMELMDEAIDSRAIHAAVLHTDAHEKAEEWKREIGEKFSCKELIANEVGPVVGTHAGPGAVGVAWYPCVD